MSSSFSEYLQLKNWMNANGVTQRYERIELPREEWYTCTTCNGTGSYYMKGNLHESAGIVPCGCHHGLTTFYLKKIYRAKARKA